MATTNRASYISKSKFLEGLQCLKLVWFRYNQKETFPEVSAATQAIFDQGHQVGALAKSLFPNGIEIGEGIVDFAQTLRLTQQALSTRVPLFEADFVYNGGYARVDILQPVGGDQWDIVEVKSSTSVKDVYFHDLAFQKFVYTGAGLKIRRCFVLHINNGYVRRGPVVSTELFTKADVTIAVDQLLPSVESNLEKIKAAIARKQFPEIKIGGHCDDPYQCALHDHCWSILPKHNVFTLVRGGKKSAKLFQNGIESIGAIPPDIKLSGSQQIQKRAIETGQPQINRAAISGFLKRLQYPVYFLDFESINPAIPLFDGASPYQQIPFQFSLHIARSETDPLEHISFLAEDCLDRRREFMTQLQTSLGTEGSIVVFNGAFEKTRLRECAQFFPEFRDWVVMVETRLLDLLTPFRGFDFYHPDQLGSASIKKVLPVLTKKSYKSLAISDGGQASLEFLRIGQTNVSVEERSLVRRQLEEYCGLDTSAMNSLLAALKTLIAN